MIKYILTDIEGTTSSISFVHEVLFPYSQKNLSTYVDKHFNEKAVQNILAEVKATVLAESEIAIDLEECVFTLKDWIVQDRKHKALKDLQGMIWEDGYKAGQFKGHVYPEVKAKFQEWAKAGIKLGVYSSGSVPAQKLIFGYSESGDLTPYFSNYFDTSVGHKRDVNSYKNILTELKIPAREVLFLSDIVEELDAAKSAGMQTTLLDRDHTRSSKIHRLVHSFNEIGLA